MKSSLNMQMKLTRIVLSRAALQAALLLMRFGQWILPKWTLSPPDGRHPVSDWFNSPRAITAAAPRTSSHERRARLDVPFFIETETEIIIGGPNDRSKPAANARKLSTATCAWLLAIGAAFSSLPNTWAATWTWTGGSFLSANWSDSANWSPTGIPGNGDVLVYPSSPLLRQTSTNDLVGLTLNQLQFLGSGPTIILGGNAFTLTNGIFVNYTFGGIYIYNNITLAGGDSAMYVTQSGYLGIGGTISGSVGVTKTGVGILSYTAAGDNPYTGTTRVNGGGLQLNVSGYHAFHGPLVIGDGSGTNNPIVALAQPMEIDAIAPVTVNLNGTLDLNGFNDVLSALTLQGGTVQSEAGTLSMGGDITVLSSSVTPVINGNVQFTGGRRTINVQKASVFRDLNLFANVTDQGGGLLFTNNAPSLVFVQMEGTNQFTGPLTLDNLTVSVNNPSALGATNSTTTVGGHGTLWLYSTGITNHSLTLADGANLTGQDDCTWAGPITLNGNVTIDSYPSAANLILLGTISGPGGFTKIDVGALELFGSSGNTYAGDTWIESGICLLDKSSGVAIPGGTLTISDHLGSNAVVRDVNVGGNLGSSLAVAVNETGILDLNGFFEVVSPITLSGGTIETGTGRLQIDGDIHVLPTTNTVTISGAIIFANGLRTITMDDSWAYPGLVIPATVADNGAGFQVVAGANFGPFDLMSLQGSNSFTGPLIINSTIVTADTPWALGTTSGGTFVTNYGVLWLNNTAITNETVTLAAGTELAGENNSIWDGPVNLLGDATIYQPSAFGFTFDVQGAITGTGNLTVRGSAGTGATVRFSGSSANTYSGTTTNFFTTLLLAKTPLGGGIPNNLVIIYGGIVRLANSWQMNSPTKSIALADTCLFDLAGYNEWVGPVTMQGSQITSGAGLLYLGGDIMVNSSTQAISTITGNASLWNGTRTINCVGHNYSPDFRIPANLGGNNSSGLIKAGMGEASLAGANNTFPGPVTVNAGSLWAETSSAFGNTNAPATVNNGGELFLDGSVAIGLKPLSLAGAGSGQGALVAGFGTNSWAGNVTLAANTTIDVYTNDTLELSGVISGPGNLTKTDWGNLLLDGGASNIFTGSTLVQQGLMTLSKTNGGAIPGAVTIGAGLDGPSGDVLRALQPNQLSLSNTVTITSSGLLDVTLASITRAGSIAGSGSVQMGSSQLMMGFDNTSNTFSGGFSGSADLTKVGTGTWTYTGTGSYGGNFGINSGQVFVDGSLASAAIFFYSGTTFGGGGTVGPITSGNGLLSVGDNGPGILNSGSLTLASGNTFLAYIAGTNVGTGYSEMSFSGGTIALGNAHLQLNMSVVGATNAHYTLIHNPTLHVISGTFNGLPEGATVTANNGVHFTITYHAGPTGNDVVLTQTSLPTPPSLTGISHSTNGTVTLHGTGAPNVTYHVQATTILVPANWINLGPVTANNLGALVFIDSQAGLYSQRFYRFVYP